MTRLQRAAGNRVVRRLLAPMVQRQAGGPRDIATLNLESPRFAGDPVLEAVFDDRRLLMRGHRGEAVQKVQQALIDAGSRCHSSAPMRYSDRKQKRQYVRSSEPSVSRIHKSTASWVP
jgi:hypothetical protein